MFRIWLKLWKEGRLKDDITFERPEDDTRTHKIFKALEEGCRYFDLEQPMWLESTIKDFKRHSKARFTRDSFIESIDFDYLEIEVIEEDDK